MPTFDYICPRCGASFQIIGKWTRDAYCTRCGAKGRRKWAVIPHVWKCKRD